MNTYWYNKLLDVLTVQTNSDNEKLMVLYLDKKLKELKLPYHIDAAGNVIVTKGKAKTYPCVTSHMDTVHRFANDFVIYSDVDNKDLLFSMDNKKRVGIGGDDKCGVFACLYMLETIPQIKVVFFSGEERRCKGSTSIDKTFFADCRYLIQLDRQGSKDFIQTYWGDKTVSHNFSSEVGQTKKKYKYKNQTGNVTDVMKLWKDKVGVSCINLSCGYYKPHTDYEYISVKGLWNSVKFTEEIIKVMKPKRYTSFPPAPAVVKTSTASAYKSIYSTCCKCHKWKKDILLYIVWNSNINKCEKMCFSCKKELGKKELGKKELGKKELGKKELGTTPQKTVENQKTEEHKIGENKIIKSTLFACHECGIKTSEMETGDSLKYVNGELYCNGCASLFYVFDKEPKKCWVCNRIIPKDHKIIERFGTRVCEDCATPSDTVAC